MSPYGSSKLMTEIMLRDAGAAHGLAYVILRYFNVAGADPQVRTGQSTKGATHLIKVAVETALGKRSEHARCSAPTIRPPTAPASATTSMSPTSPAPIRTRSRYLRAGGASVTLNCGYGHGFSVLEVIETVKRVSGVDFRSTTPPRRPGDPAQIVGEVRPHPRDARMAAAIRRPCHHRRPRTRLGTQARHPAELAPPRIGLGQSLRPGRLTFAPLPSIRLHAGTLGLALLCLHPHPEDFAMSADASRYVISPPPQPAIAVVGSDKLFPVRRIWCVGRNYLEHIKEMGQDEREPPFFFAKPADAIAPDGATIPYPPLTKDLHHEVELWWRSRAGVATSRPPRPTT